MTASGCLIRGGRFWRTPAFVGAILVSAAGFVQAATPSPDEVLAWNDQTNRAIQVTGTDPFKASRALALESIAVMDTVKSIAGGPAFLVRLPAQPNTPVAPAVAAAAHAMLCYLFPSRQAALDAALAASLANEPPGPARIQAVTLGEAVAAAVIAVRDRDGWNATREMRIGAAPGQWRPTPPALLPPLDPQWAAVTPFALSRPDQFRPPGPPAPGTAAFNEARAQTAAVGEAHSSIRTAEQTVIARYWSDAIGTYAPAGHWNAITASIVAPMRLGLAAEAELFAELNIAIADAGIAMADAKYTYWSWRPITAIRAGDAAMPANSDWSPLLATPNHPSYISGHSSFSGAAAVVLTARLGTRPFSFASASLPGVTRSFTSFHQAADEAALSRMYGGIHYAFDNVDGLTTGRAVGTWTLATFQRIAEDRGPLIVLDRPREGKDSRGMKGFALDNLSPVTAVSARVDGDPAVSVAVDGRGRFALPPALFGPSRRHAVVLAVTSAAGRTVSLRLETEGSELGDVVTAPLTTK